MRRSPERYLRLARLANRRMRRELRRMLMEKAEVLNVILKASKKSQPTQI
jgi:hypothetical protein